MFPSVVRKAAGQTVATVRSIGSTRVEEDFDPGQILRGEGFERNDEYALHLILVAPRLPQ